MKRITLIFLLFISSSFGAYCNYETCVPSVLINVLGVTQEYEQKFIEINMEVEDLKSKYEEHSEALDEDIEKINKWTNNKIEFELKLKELIRIKKEIEHDKYIKNSIDFPKFSF